MFLLHFQVRKISNVLQAQHFLDRLCKALKDAAAKEDLAEGKNGASKLTKEQIDAVFEFSRAVGDKATSDFDKSGELWNCLVESRKQKVGKSSSTFKEAMEALELTIACGYLDNLKVEEEKEERSSPESKEGGKAKKDRRKDKEQGKNKQQQQVRMNGAVKLNVHIFYMTLMLNPPEWRRQAGAKAEQQGGQEGQDPDPGQAEDARAGQVA